MEVHRIRLSMPVSLGSLRGVAPETSGMSLIFPYRSQSRERDNARQAHNAPLGIASCGRRFARSTGIDSCMYRLSDAPERISAAGGEGWHVLLSSHHPVLRRVTATEALKRRGKSPHPTVPAVSNPRKNSKSACSASQSRRGTNDALILPRTYPVTARAGRRHLKNLPAVLCRRGSSGVPAGIIVRPVRYNRAAVRVYLPRLPHCRPPAAGSTGNSRRKRA